jgi:hypothetical protein
MAFTQDELQSLHSIFDEKLAAQRRDLERLFEQRLETQRHEIEHRLLLGQRELQHVLNNRLEERNKEAREGLQEGLRVLQLRFDQVLVHHIDLHQQEQLREFEASVENTLAAQLIAFEQLLSQHLSVGDLSANEAREPAMYTPANVQQDLGVIEVQTEIPWDDLVELVDRTFASRLDGLQQALTDLVKSSQSTIIEQMRSLRSTFEQPRVPVADSALVQAVEQLERLVESMQVALVANDTFLANRLSLHQQLPSEQAHGHLMSTEASREVFDEDARVPETPVQQESESPSTEVGQ